MKKILSSFFVFLIFVLPSLAAVKGGVEYAIPIDYSKLNTQELENKAVVYYKLALASPRGKVTEDVTTALNLYTMLENAEPENVSYVINLGKLYDRVNMDKFAKGNFYKAMGLNPNLPVSYFCLGEFYYEREMYKKALKFYKLAYTKGNQSDYKTLYKIGDIYEKLGDTQASLKYLILAHDIAPNSKLDEKIKYVQQENQINKQYYSNTRIRLNK